MAKYKNTWVKKTQQQGQDHLYILRSSQWLNWDPVTRHESRPSQQGFQMGPSAQCSETVVKPGKSTEMELYESSAIVFIVETYI